MASYSRITVMGNVGNDPRVATVNVGGNERRVANFNVAVNDPFNPEAPSVWYAVTVWGKPVDFVERFVKKGTNVLVDGRPGLRSYAAKDGTERTEITIQADRVVSNSPKPKNEESEEDEELPF